MVFAKCAVKYVKQQGLVGKTMSYFTGPLQVTKSLCGSSYELLHCNTNRPGKRHAAHLSPLHQELIPFQPV